MKNIIKGLLLSIFAIFIFTGCGAEGELEDMGIAYTQDDYFKHGVYKHNIPVLDLFYEAGMPVETKDKDGDTALDSAIYKGQLEMIKFLIEEHNAKINNKSLTYFIKKRFRGEENSEKVLKYLFSKGAKLTDNGAFALSRYYTNSKTMDPSFMLIVAKNGLSAKESTRRLTKIYKEFAFYTNNKIRNAKVAITEINKTAKSLIPLIEQLIKNGANIKEAYSRFNIQTYRNADNKNDWIMELVKPIVESKQIDLNQDKIITNKTILESILFAANLENVKNTIKYLSSHGVKPTGNDISLFCVSYSTYKPSQKCNKEAFELFIK